ncbi:hypothetical protein [Sorangium sp. So ce1335]|uniref:hypothetical protein n=1 Tax=Sorangium sp. So ce1335 TaxID=3133335 RepID=UPI003F5F6767
MTNTTKLVLAEGVASGARLYGNQVRVGARQRSSGVATPHPLPVLLAGPILRRATESGAVVWVAMSARCQVTMSVLSSASLFRDDRAAWRVVASGSSRDIKQLGAHLFVVAIEASGAITPNVIHAYDLEFEAPDGMAFDHDQGLLAKEEIAYKWFPLPTFFVSDQRQRRLNFLHASCRKLHGPGQDAIRAANDHIETGADDVSLRPAAFFFTGDQIYADDVPGDLGEAVAHAGELLTGYRELLPDHDAIPREARGRYPRQLPYDRRSPGGHARQDVLTPAHGFTYDTEIGPHHLMSFGEYAAMYVLAWSPELWRARTFARHRSFFRSREQDLVAIRRVMANVPCYMMMDDHETSDDIVLVADQWDRIRHSYVGRWVVANAWSAIWAFQMLGQRTRADSALWPHLRRYISAATALGAHAFDPPSASDASVRAMYDQHRAAFHRARDAYSWNVVSYSGGFDHVAPTHPPAVLVDMRTRRGLDDGCPALLSGPAMRELGSTVSGLEGGAETPVLLVSPAPVIGMPLIEAQQMGRATDYPRDPEAWSLNSRAYFELFDTLSSSGKRAVVVLSGDVHYGFMISARFYSLRQSRGVAIAQLTSSSLRNQSAGDSRDLLRLGRSLQGRSFRHVFDSSESHRVEHAPEHGVPHASTSDGTLDFGFEAVNGSDYLAMDNNVGIVTVAWDEARVTVDQRLVGVGLGGDPGSVVLE